MFDLGLKQRDAERLAKLEHRQRVHPSHKFTDTLRDTHYMAGAEYQVAKLKRVSPEL